MTEAYEMLLQPLLSAQDIDGLPFGSVYGTVPPGTTSKRHTHHDGEAFIVLAGEAWVGLGAEERKLSRGDVCYLTPFDTHWIRNDGTEAFDIVSIYWEHAPTVAAALAERAPRTTLPSRTLVFCPPATPNGGLHLGHLSGPYVRADMLTRALRSMGREALLITGTDDHQSHVAVAARCSGTSPREISRIRAQQILDTLTAAGVELSAATVPHRDAAHTQRVNDEVARLAARQEVAESDVVTAYCAACDVSLFQGWSAGGCRVCAAEADGEICEACGIPNETRQLDQPYCTICRGPASERIERSLTIDVEALAARIRAYLDVVEMSPDIRALSNTLTAGPQGLATYRLTRHAEWGVAVSGRAGEVVDAWVDLALTYLHAARQHGGGVPDTRKMLFLGLDNTYFYVVVLPAVAILLGQEALLPDALVTNQFLHLGNAKFSTSRGHAVWAEEALTGNDADTIRAALLRRAPEGRVTSIPDHAARAQMSDVLVDAVAAWREHLVSLAASVDFTIPGTGAWTVAHREFYRYLNSIAEQLDGVLLPASFSARSYVRLLDSLLARIAEFAEAESVLRDDSAQAEEARTSEALQFLATKALAALLWPVMPQTGEELWAWLGLDGTPMRETHWSFIPSGTRCGKQLTRSGS
ncbi:class I tRNA ligase family protein [Salinispora arenicola]|uniref:class I tRNA ligase family protein n=1 Tax=Salinispora arenicola TaxID=168697 RepID=UPI001E4A3608|nr:class I tRNA ligase family protein [Salinispora arenicola]